MAKKADFDYIWTDKKRTLFGLPISFTRYFLTETKFITRKGFLSLVEDEMDLYKVTDKKLVLKFFQRIFKCGTIVINVKDIDTPIKEIKSVKKPREVLAMLDKQIDINRDKYNIRGRDMIGGGHHVHPGDVMDAMDHEDMDHDEHY
ncbi:MAG: PH domain-containing protein [Ruminococcus sp.]|nr:PH domain-containing protein [Ruminococcus sp.]